MKGVSQVFKGNGSTPWDKKIEQITKEETDEVYNAQGNETGEEGKEYNSSILQELDEVAFFLRFFFTMPL